LPIGIVLACQGEPTTPSAESVPTVRFSALVGSDVVSRVRTLPDSQLVFANDFFQVTAQATNSLGELLERTFTWTVTSKSVAGAVPPLGPTTTFKALKIGKTSIKAAADGKSAISKVVVRSTVGGKVILTPATAAVEPGATVQFVAAGLTKNGETASVNVTWTATAGTVSATGLLEAGTEHGTYHVVATSRFGAADTAVVTIGPAPDPLQAIVLVPESAELEGGETLRFEAYGIDAGGDSVEVPVSYAATGGTIQADGDYTAGSVAGTYEVVATGPDDVADTSEVTVTVTPPSLDRVVLLPDVAASRPGAVTRFSATALNTLGETVAEPITYSASCGTVTGAGVYTAPDPGAGVCEVIAAAGDKADTTEVALLVTGAGRGRAFGLFGLWTTATAVGSGTAPYTASHDNIMPADLVPHINAARSKGIRLMLSMTGGSHDNYKTNGVFDEGKWRAAMDAFNTSANRDAVAAAVADGTIIGNSVMDEPQQSGTDSKAWGPKGTMTKARVDGLCSYVRGIFPTLPIGVFHDPGIFEPDSSYQVCEFLISQFATRKGNVVTWRDNGLAIVQRDGMKIIFSLNLLDGGTQDRDGTWNCAGTGGLGTFSPNCQMTPDQIRTYAEALAPPGCALLSWRLDTPFLTRPENAAVLSSVALMVAALPLTPCVREQ
jgi:hypothetical protein